MKQKTQRETNPFPYTDSNKRYHTYDYAQRKRFGGKCVKITLDGGFSCPNIDGTCGVGGCIYCSSHGSGDFTQDAALPIAEQFAAQVERMQKKWNVRRFIPYLQPHTNTYGSIEKIKEIYRQIELLPDVVGINIATRADCLSEDVLALLAEMAERTVLTVELGLQSVHDRTAERIHRGHSYRDFVRGFEALRRASDRIEIAVHLIDGLPGESREDMLQTAETVGALHPEQIKLHLLHVLSGTQLADMYLAGEYTPLTLEEYTSVVVAQLERIPPEIVIGRITGDGAEDALLAPLWSKKKFVVMNAIDRELYAQNTWQGRLCTS